MNSAFFTFNWGVESVVANAKFCHGLFGDVFFRSHIQILQKSSLRDRERFLPGASVRTSENGYKYLFLVRAMSHFLEVSEVGSRW